MAAKLTAEFLKDWKNDVNPDLQKERDTATFKTEELTRLLDGGVEKTQRRKELGIQSMYVSVSLDGALYNRDGTYNRNGSKVDALSLIWK